MNMIKKNGGFTLVELIVVIAILAILAGVAVPAYSGYISKANEAADYTMLDSIKTAIVFAVMEENPEATVDNASVTFGENGAITATVTSGTGESATTVSVDISEFVDSYTPKSGATSATWNGEKWTLVKPSTNG